MPGRPDPAEYDPFYGAYIDLVPAGDVLQLLETQLLDTLGLIGRVPAEKETTGYAPGKWSVRDVVGHLIDTERTFVHRALAIAREDPGALPSMDQNDYATSSNANARPLSALSDELVAVRGSSVALFRSFTDEMWFRKGIASGVSFTVRTFPYIVAGHELHHRGILADRYLGVLP
jgi:uncharacterized damage-inducible protein DinB